MRIVFGFLVAMALLNAGSALAQENEKLMEGAKTYGLFPSTNEHNDCPYSTADIVRAVNYPISSSKLKEGKGADIYITIRVSLLPIRAGTTLIGCAYHLDFEATDGIFANIDYNQKSSYFEALLYSRDMIGVTAMETYIKDINDEIEDYTKEFLTQYNNDNK